MKNFAYILASMAVFLLTACGGGSSDDGDGSTPDGQTNRQSVTLSATNADMVVTLNKLTTEIQTVTGAANWLTVIKESYTSGAPTLRLTATDNVKDGETTGNRSCNVTIIAKSGDKVILTVTQEGSESKTGIDDSHDVMTDQPAYSR